MDCKVSLAQMETLRTTLHRAVDGLLERLATGVLAAPEPTLEGLERAVLAELHALGNAALGGLCATLAPRYPPAHAACGCGGAATARYQRQRTAQCKTLLGGIELKRAYYLCGDCHQGHCPLDRSLGLSAGGISDGLEALLALLGAEFSYSHAAELVEQVSLVTVSAGRCRSSAAAAGGLGAGAGAASRLARTNRCASPRPALRLGRWRDCAHTRDRLARTVCRGGLHNGTCLTPPCAAVRQCARRASARRASTAAQPTTLLHQ